MTKPLQKTTLALLVVLLFSNMALAASDQSDEAQIKAIIEAIRVGWLEADGAPFRKHYLDFEGARYIKTGGQNEGLSDLINHHVEPEADAFENFELKITNPEAHLEGDNFAWVVTDSEIQAKVKRDGRIIHNKGHGTYLLRKVDGEWKVVHTHTSSRPVRKHKKKEHKH